MTSTPIHKLHDDVEQSSEDEITCGQQPCRTPEFDETVLNFNH